MSKSKAVVSKDYSTSIVEKTAQTPEQIAADWGIADQKLTSRDFTIPKILPMQAMSKKVTGGEAAFGEFRDSLTGVVLGDTKNPIEFVPFYMEKVYVVMREENGKFSFDHQEPITQANEEHEYEVTGKDGKKEKWYRTMQFYVLLPKEVALGTAIPYILTFRSTSARAGNKLTTTMFMKNLKAGKTPASMTMELTGEKTSNDKGTFIVMDVKEKRESSQAEIKEAFNWVQTIKKGKVKIDHSDLESAKAEEVPVSNDY